MIHYTNTDNPIDFPTAKTPARKAAFIAFEAWLDSPAGATDLTILDILDGAPSRDTWIAFLAGRESMHKEVMEEWNNPIGKILKEHGKMVHIADRLKGLL